MITNKGTELLGKYLVGQIPTFVSHIAIGCGEKSLLNSEDFGDYSGRTALTFETSRVPIVSRTVSLENGVNEVVFTAELPVAERYAITEIGIYPSERNNSVGTEPSRIMFGFEQSENWLFHNTTTSVISQLPIQQSRLDNTTKIGNIEVTDKFFQTYPDNATFLFEQRLNRQEQTRYLSNTVILRGDVSALDDTTCLPSGDEDHIHITGVDLSFLDKVNPALDQIKLAFSVINKNLAGEDPTKIKVLVEFANSEDSESAAYARLIFNTVGDDTFDPLNRYVVTSKNISELSKSSNFNWSLVSTIKIYVDVDNSSNYYVALDALAFENLASVDSQYGLAGYTILKNQAGVGGTQSRPVIKYDNELSLLEFRFSLDVA